MSISALGAGDDFATRKDFVVKTDSIWAHLIKFEHNWGEICAKVIRLGQSWLDLSKIKTLHPKIIRSLMGMASIMKGWVWFIN